ncbi:lipoyl protein ligase domain-containing protein [Pelomicrobium methylotrophicum]|uniref:DUF116 domain-containing protein n=1 Tax=Pelomicrobium methylotrophicum TaxID=2602750 RepID=A0A5C7EHL0_9PROT|nr:DUF116 domain-containing protein [Pelomicrobium methylotrophicum]TXF11736.1 DUF116 domain-containing protein [Pelomicrobium methylotrophicum]
MSTRPVLFQVVDTGLRPGLENHALDRAWLRTHARGSHIPVLRFHRSLPTASLGRFQAAGRELRLDVCARRGIEVARRLSGGGALYLDPQQLGFSVIAPAAALRGIDSLTVALAVTGSAIAEALTSLGIRARFKQPNDLEIDGRKIASVFAACEAGAWLLQGTVLLGVDVKSMLEALKVPTEKLSRDGLAAARDRLTTVEDQLGTVPALEVLRGQVRDALARAFGWRPDDEVTTLSAPVPARLVEHERRAARLVDWSAPQAGAVEVLWKIESRTVRLRAQVDADGPRLRTVEVAADVHARPPTLFETIARRLSDCPVDVGVRRVAAFLHGSGAEAAGVDAQAIARLAALALDVRRFQGAAALSDAQANAVMIHSPDGTPACAILERATVMLVPYCAKPVWCKWRHRDGCPECGQCEVGEAYRLARERGMRVITITRYEHLVETLAQLQRDGSAYVGMCCSHFYLKRHRAFAEAGLPAVLMDVSGANCYELHQEAEAYAGRFQAQARLDLPLLANVMRFVPRRKPGGPASDQGKRG